MVYVYSIKLFDLTCYFRLCVEEMVGFVNDDNNIIIIIDGRHQFFKNVLTSQKKSNVKLPFSFTTTKG